MEFAICPACKQSVLDDDATECPFCGASMKSKPGAKPAPKAPTAATNASAGKPASKPAGKPTVAKPNDDLPFGLSDAVAAPAVAAARNPTKGRTLKVVCPMCETEGYVPPTAAGSDVKCANSQCLVPVFKAPVPVAEPEASPPPKKSGNLVVLGLGTVAVVGGIGAGLYFFAGQPQYDGPSVQPVDLSQYTQNSSGNTATDVAKPVDPTPAEGTATAPAAGPVSTAPSEKVIVAEALQQVQQSSLVSDRTNRSKPYCRRFAAEAFALAGDIAGAKEQIAALNSVGAQLPFYQVTPWVEVFWQEHRRGNAAGASQAIETALKQADQLPVRGSDQLDVATRLAAGLTAAGKIDVAQRQISAHQSADQEGEFSANLRWLAADASGTDLEWLIQSRPIVPRIAPQAAAVAASLVLRGESGPALNYAKAWTDARTQLECLSAWAEAIVWTSPATAKSTLAAALTELPPIRQSYLWARAARVAKARKSQSLAQELLSLAAAPLADHPAGTAYSIPATRVLVKTRPTWDRSALFSVIAAAEVAAAQFEVAGDAAAAGTSLQLALSHSRLLGPARPPTQVLVEAANGLGATGLRNQLKAELSLRSDDEARLAMGEYRRSLTDLETAANDRFQLQETLLARLTQLGLEGPVWAFVSQSATGEDDSLKEDFLATEVAVWLRERFLKTQNSGDERLLNTARANARLPELTRPAEVEFREKLAAGDMAAAWQAAGSLGLSGTTRDNLILRAIIAQSLSAESLEALWKLISPLTDVALREQAVEWSSWMAARRGAAADVWSHRKSLVSATEIIALSRGVVAGIADRQRTAPASDQATTASMP